MKSTLTLLLTLIMLTNCKGNAQESMAQNRLQNEYWAWKSDNLIYYETFFFSENGRFQYISMYSGGSFLSVWFSGIYDYNPQNQTITLLVDNCSIQDDSGRLRLVANACPKNIHIDNMTAKEVIVTDSTAREEGSLLLRGGNTKTFNRQQKDNILMVPEGLLQEIDAMEIQGKESTISTKVNKNDKKQILKLLNLAVFDKEQNDGRMIKMPEPKFSIHMKGNHQSYQTTVNVWDSQMDVQGIWYNLQNTSQLEEVLKKYVPNKQTE